MRIVSTWPHRSIKIPWQFKSEPLTQDLYLESIIEKYQCRAIKNLNLLRWDKYQQGSKPWDLVMISFTDWSDMDHVVRLIDQQSSKLVLVNINKYMINPSPGSSDVDDYNQAIIDVLGRGIVNYEIIDHRFYAQERGNVGNFIVPDNQILCSKKT
jgi:hypothetical protein